MKILLVSSAFHPENSPRSFRASELAKEFSRQGHKVTLLTLPYGSATEDFCRMHKIELKYTHPRKFKQLQLSENRLLNLLKRGVNRVLLQLFEYPDIELAFRFAPKLQFESGYDLLISFAVPYPVHWSVAYVRKTKRLIANKWIADCGDPYTGNESDSFKKLFYFSFIEKWMFKRVDHIVIPIDGARKGYYREFHSKISVIPQGLNLDELGSSKRPYKKKKICSFAYAGTFIHGFRDPRKFLDHLLGMPQDFRFYIFSKKDAWLMQYADASNNRIIIRDFIPRNNLIEELSQMDFLVNIENSTTVQAPSKLIDYYLAGRPVLSLKSKEVNEVLIEDFFRGNYENGLSMNGFDQFDIGLVSRSFIALA